MIDKEDFTIIKNGSYRVKHYRMTCDECKVDRGYKRQREADRLCGACSKRSNMPSNVNISDFITDPREGSTKRLYKISCPNCGLDKGYQSTSRAYSLCYSCSMLKRWNSGGMRNMRSAKRQFEYDKNNHKVIFKSSYELAYANYLDSNNICWDYEPIYSLSDGTNILPDFKLSDGTVVEIKGYFRPDAKLKWDMFCTEYPDIKKFLLMKADLQNLKII